MARPIDRNEATKLIRYHQALLEELNQAAGRWETQRREIYLASENMTAQEVENALKNIPVEEINRD